MRGGREREDEGAMGGIRKKTTSKARRGGIGMLMFAAPSIRRDEGRNVDAGLSAWQLNAKYPLI
jgi:hypothetical protein